MFDRYELMVYYNIFGEDVRFKNDIHYLRTQTVSTEVVHKDQFVYGLLVKHEDDFQFLSDFMISNRDVINACNNLFLNKYSRKLRIQVKKHSLFSTDGEMFYPSLVTSIVLISLIFIFGVFYQLRLKSLDHNNNCVKSLLRYT